MEIKDKSVLLSSRNIKSKIDYELSDKIFGLVKFSPKVYKDLRGENWEGYSYSDYLPIVNQSSDFNFNGEFVIDSFSYSKRGCIRGFHGDYLNLKLVETLVGSIILVVIDTRSWSPTFNNIEIFELNQENRNQILIPAGCVNAHECLSDECIFHYKLSHCYVDISNQIHIKWNDPKYSISWKTQNPILSDRDK